MKFANGRKEVGEGGKGMAFLVDFSPCPLKKC